MQPKQKPLSRTEITALVISTLRDVLSRQSETRKHKKAVQESTPLIGEHSVCDSLGLVNLIVDVEQRLQEEHGILLTLADERALSQKISPFRTVSSLVDYIERLIREEIPNDAA
ncbi:MAG: hypothetical protein HY313_00195 [Acidobacteria bacterium]|nr:hypothetical protein [Acidobacteriota bacterium]